MTGKLAIDGGTPVLQRSDYTNWPIITDDDHRLINEVLGSGIFAGGTASGKTTSLNAVSLFIPPLSKIVLLKIRGN